MVELLQLIEHDIPEGRHHLQDSHSNLEKVAAYCEGNYLQVSYKYVLVTTRLRYENSKLPDGSVTEMHPDSGAPTV